MSDKELQGIINRMVKIAHEHTQLSLRIDEICLARYGHTYSELDCDDIIDMLDYNGGKMTVAEFDASMRDSIERITKGEK